MRGLKTVERELAQVEEILSRADQLGPSYDNDGNLVYTPQQRVAMYKRRAEQLRTERASFRKILGLED